MAALAVHGSSVAALRLSAAHGPRSAPRRRQGAGLEGDLVGARAARPEPPLYPRDPPLRREVEAAERWGEEVLQDAARRIEVWELRRDHRMVATQLADAHRIQGARVPINPRLAAMTSGPTIAWYARLISATDEAVRRDLGELRAMLDRVDSWIADGVLGGDEPNAADYQIAPCLSLLMTVGELRRAIEPRPAGRLALGLVPEYPGRSAGVLPREWLVEAGLIP